MWQGGFGTFFFSPGGMGMNARARRAHIFGCAFVPPLFLAAVGGGFQTEKCLS